MDLEERPITSVDVCLLPVQGCLESPFSKALSRPLDEDVKVRRNRTDACPAHDEVSDRVVAWVRLSAKKLPLYQLVYEKVHLVVCEKEAC